MSTVTQHTEPKPDKMTVASLMSSEVFKNQLRMALPKHMTPDRMIRIAMTELRRTPKLQECTPFSFIGSVIQTAQLGLEPGNMLGHAYLIPYGKECQIQIGYKGMIDLARRSGQIVSLQAHVAYSKDDFHYEYGLTPLLRHIPAKGDRGAFTYVYACAILKDGGSQFEVMSKEDVQAIMKSSKTAHSGPWQTHFDEMARKTVVRRLFKYLPVSIELTRAITLDEAADQGIQNNAALYEDLGNVLDDVEHSTKADRLTETLSTP